MVGEKIVRARNDFEYFGLIDKATDVSTHEQISASARFVECTGRKVTLRDEFLGFEGKRKYL